MLAYVFWHWRAPAVAEGEYLARQRAFHAALAAAPPPGFVRSRSMAISGAPWANGGAAAYEDWYLVEGSAALDPLSDAAVSGSRRTPHDAAAAAAGGGTAGLYRLRLGSAEGSPEHALWFAKPAGMSYADLWGAMQPVVAGSGGALWGRQMVLGPAPELCLHTTLPVELPAPFEPLPIPLDPVWSGRDPG